MSESFNIYEAKAQLSKLVERVESGEEILLSRNGRAVARIVPLSWNAPGERKPGIWAGGIVEHQDFYAFTEQDERDWYGE